MSTLHHTLTELLRDRPVGQSDEEFVQDILLTFQCELEDLLTVAGTLGVEVGLSYEAPDELAANELGMGGQYTKWKAYSEAMKLRDKCQCL